MADLKTKPTNESVKEFLNKVEPEQKRKDSFELLEIMKDVTGEKPVMWGSGIVGFGSYHYKYASGREGDWMKVGFSPRKKAITLYLMGMAYNFDKEKDLLEKLGNVTHGKGCLYIKKLSDIDSKVLRKLIKKSAQKTPSSS